MASVGAAPRSLWGSSRRFGASETRKLTSRRVWERQYIARLRVTDVLAVTLSVALAQIVRFGGVETSGLTNSVIYTGVSIAVATVWIAFLAIFRTRSTRVIGNGAEEYRRIV
ncbi:MAG: sugar transferase, partial [Rhodococcus sp. (in: high G+C Gram-positive bacteria)]